MQAQYQLRVLFQLSNTANSVQASLKVAVLYTNAPSCLSRR